MAFQVIKILKLACVLVCIVLFCLLMADIFDKFSQKMTSIGIIIEEFDKDAKDLPCFTLCPWKAFRNPGLHFEFEDFQRNIFNQSEIFSDVEIYFADKSLYIVEEINNFFLGRCFMVCYQQPIKKMMENNVLLCQQDLKGNTIGG